MTTYVCPECGERNPAGTEFCQYCHAFLAWDETDQAPARKPPAAAPAPRRPEPVRQPEQNVETRMIPRIEDERADRGESSQEAPPLPAGEAESPEAPREESLGLFALVAEQNAVTVAATGEITTVNLRVSNTSAIVDGYAIEAPGAPGWLSVEAGELHLLPGVEDVMAVRMRITSEALVPAQRNQLVLRVRSLSQAPARSDVPIWVTIPVVDVPVLLRAEPRLLRVRDRDTADCRLLVDNSRSNRRVHLQFSGSDPELAVQFRFDPPVLEVGPGATGSVSFSARAPGPEPGQEISRALTLTALDGERSVETLVTMQQSTTARVEDPLVKLEVVPSLVRVRNTTSGTAQVVADNRAGTEWAHLKLQASDPERAVQVSWATPVLHVPPGRTAQTEVSFEAPLPDAGTEVARTVTVAAHDGKRTATATATFSQAASASPMATLAVRLEPTVVRVQDADSASLTVLLDNRKGGSEVRLYLQGSDPEGAIRFTFSPPVVDLEPGQTRQVRLQLDAWRPPPGQESTRQFTVVASDGDRSVEASGSLVQASSRAAIELLSLQLDPSVLHLSSGRRGQVTAVLDNRRGAQPVRVSMRGDDPQNIVRFTFNPAMLEIPPGSVTTTLVSVEAPRAAAGQELTRPFGVLASDGRTEVKAEGTLIQSAPERRSLRPVFRGLLTLLGGLAVILGALLPFRSGDGETATGFDINEVAQEFGGGLILAGFEVLITVGLVLIALGVLMMFGLTAPKGRLTRLAAVLAAIVVAGLLVAFALVNQNAGLGQGAVLVLAGCIIGYIGGLLVKR